MLIPLLSYHSLSFFTTPVFGGFNKKSPSQLGLLMWAGLLLPFFGGLHFLSGSALFGGLFATLHAL